MTCKEFEELMTAYLEGDLPPERRGSFEKHISSCVRCQEAMSAYENCTRIFQKFVKDEDPPEALRTAVFEKCGCKDDSDRCRPPERDK